MCGAFFCPHGFFFGGEGFAPPPAKISAGAHDSILIVLYKILHINYLYQIIVYAL